MHTHWEISTRHDLQGMHGGDNRGIRLHQALLPQDAQFQIGEAGALAGAASISRDRHTAHDDEINGGHLAHGDQLPVPHGTARRGGDFQGHILLTHGGGGQRDKTALPGQAGHGHVQYFTFLQGPQAYWRLGLIGIAFDHLRLLPHGERCQARRRLVRTYEARDMPNLVPHCRPLYCEVGPDGRTQVIFGRIVATPWSCTSRRHDYPPAGVPPRPGAVRRTGYGLAV